MKIRTDFVTNSSSSNYVTINIKSPKLTEILRAARVCKETGETDDDEWGWYGRDRLEIDESEHIVKLKWEISGFLDCWDVDMDSTNDEDLMIGYPPEKLSDLPESLLNLLKETGEGTLSRQGYDPAKIYSALEKNGEEILADTESADWLYETEGRGEANLFSWFWKLSNTIAKKENLDYRPSSAGLSCSFHYDKENGESTKGEYSYSKPYGKDSAEDDFDIELVFSEDDSDIELGFSEDDPDIELGFSEDDPDIELGFSEDDPDIELDFSEDDPDIELDFSEDDSDIELDFSEDDSEFETDFPEEDGEDWVIEDDLAEEEE